MAVKFIRKSAWTSGFGTSGSGSFDCTDCDFVVVFAIHGAPGTVSVDTLNDVDGTNIGIVSETAEGHYVYNSGHYWLTPGSGTKTLTIIWSSNGTNRTVILGYRGAKQAAIIQSGTAHGWGGTASKVLTSTVVGNLIVDGAGFLYGTPWQARTVGALQTSRSNTAWAADTSKLMESCSEEPGNDGSVTMSWTESGSPKWAQIAIEIEQTKTINQGIWLMSKIYDQIQENRKKLGIGDLGNFKRSLDGLWKPQPDLVTI